MNKFLFIQFVWVLVFAGAANALPKRWHESGGFATDIQAGLGGKVIKVTNLNNEGPGSLREAVNASGPRLIVFEVGGVINLDDSDLKVSNGQATIAGETAPPPGISLVRGNFSVVGEGNVVVSHINVMLGDEVSENPDCVNINADYVVFNHLGIYWSKDENFSIRGPANITAYKCIIGEGLQYAGHEDGEHSKGSLITDTENLSLIGCLYAHNAMRNPRIGTGDILIANGVVYNWAPGWDHRGPVPDRYNPVITDDWFNFVFSAAKSNITFVGNVGLAGPESVGEFFVDGHMTATAHAYMDDNIIIDTLGNDLKVYDPTGIKPLEKPPLWCDGLEPMPAHESLYELLRTVGPRPGDRDFHNARLVKTVADGNGELIDSPKEVGGYPEYPQTQRPIQVPEGAAARRAWLDSLEDGMAVDMKIDLSRLYGLVGSAASDKYRLQGNAIGGRRAEGFDIRMVRGNTPGERLRARLALPTAGAVTFEAYNLAGKAVARTPEKFFPAGYHELGMDVRDLPPGLYVLRFGIGGAVRELLFPLN